MRPVIGITTASLSSLEGIGEPHPESSVVGLRYVQAVTAAGGVPWPIPVVSDAGTLRSVYRRLDGLVLAGGSDIRPGRYQASPGTRLDGGDERRDEVEAFLAAWASEEGKPTLGVCRGMQMLNVSRGGTLLQDLRLAGKGTLRHDNYPLSVYPRDLLAHRIRVRRGTRTAASLGMGNPEVNSIHHQAVDRVGEGLTVTATAPDGVVEAVEDRSHPFFVGVQWHPEELPTHPAMRRLFGVFVRTCTPRNDARGVLVGTAGAIRDPRLRRGSRARGGRRRARRPRRGR